MTQEGAPAGARIIGSASVLAAGNVASRMLGLIREAVIAADWGGSLQSSAFTAASRVPTLLYDLLVGGMLSAALVPVLSAYATRDRAEFWRAAGTLVTAAAAVCGLAAAAVYAFAPSLGWLLGAGYGPEGVAIVTGMLRILAPSVLAFGVSGVLMGLLYALQRFSLPAATGAIYNLAFILGAIAFRDQLGVYALSIGVTLGALAQLAVLAPGLLAAGMRFRPGFRHPALRRVLMLYVPLAAGLVISLVQGGAEPGLASRWGEAGLAWMRFATNLIQFPHGLIAIAISAAILPRLAQNHALEQGDEFASTLSRGLRAVMALTLPAAVGLAVLAEPVVGLVFERGAFNTTDRTAVVSALHLYLIGLPFASIDWPLNYAYYARQNTLVPAAVGALSVGLWFVVALAVPPLIVARSTVDHGYLGLVLADSAKHTVHAAVMLALAWRITGGRGLAGLPRTALASGAAALVMGAVVALVDGSLAARLVSDTGGWALRCGAGVTLGLAVYAGAAHVFGVSEIGWLFGQVRARWKS